MADEIPKDPYGTEYQEQMFQKLAPQVEAIVAKMFPHSRGARFGAQGSILAKRLAALKVEIAMDATKRGAAHQEQLRREGVAKQVADDAARRTQGEEMRKESVRAMENERFRSWNEINYRRSQDEAKTAAQEAQRTALRKEAYDRFAGDSTKAEEYLAKMEAFNNPPDPNKKTWAEDNPIKSMASWWNKGNEETAKVPYNERMPYDGGPDRVGNPPPVRGFQPLASANVPGLDLEKGPGVDAVYDAKDPLVNYQSGGFKDTSLRPMASEFGPAQTASAGGFSASGPGTGASRDVQLPSTGKYGIRNIGGQNMPVWMDNSTGEGLKYTSPGGKLATDSLDPVRGNAARVELSTRVLPRGFRTSDFPGPGQYMPDWKSGFSGGVSSSESDPLREIDKYRLKNPTPGQAPDFDPYAVGSSRSGGTRYMSGNVNERTPREFRKVGRSIEDTARSIWQGFGGRG